MGIDKWKYIKVPDVPLSEQKTKKIVNKIKNELDKLKKEKKETEDKRNKIDEIVNDYLKK